MYCVYMCVYDIQEEKILHNPFSLNIGERRKLQEAGRKGDIMMRKDV